MKNLNVCRSAAFIPLFAVATLGLSACGASAESSSQSTATSTKPEISPSTTSPSNCHRAIGKLGIGNGVEHAIEIIPNNHLNGSTITLVERADVSSRLYIDIALGSLVNGVSQATTSIHRVPVATENLSYTDLSTVYNLSIDTDTLPDTPIVTVYTCSAQQV
jgi:hypothetical protein